MLIPCVQCRRHVRSDASACPFCARAIEQAPARASLVGRFSRAAVFAGLASCGGPSTPVVNQPDRTTQTVDRYDVKPAPGMGTVRGSMRDAQGNPIGGYTVQLGDKTATTDAQGFYTFENLPPGMYEVIFPNPSTRRGLDSRMAEVKPDEIIRVDFQRPAPEVHDPGMEAKPYGAPPARRRIV